MKHTNKNIKRSYLLLTDAEKSTFCEVRLKADSDEKLTVDGLSLWLIGTVRAEPETVISRAWVQSPDPAE